jgi:hypothetical protein
MDCARHRGSASAPRRAVALRPALVTVIGNAKLPTCGN